MKLIFSSIFIFLSLISYSQGSIFRDVNFDSLGIKLYEMCVTKEGAIHFSSSAGLFKLQGHQIESFYSMPDKAYKSKTPKWRFRGFNSEDGIRSIAQGPDSLFYFVTHDNRFLCRENGNIVRGWGWFLEFNFPKTSPVTKIWIDNESNLFVGTREENFYIIEKTGRQDFNPKSVEWGADKDSMVIVTKGGKPVRQVVLKQGLGVYSFVADAIDPKKIWIGTNEGLFTYNKTTKEGKGIDRFNNVKVTITEIYSREKDIIWFSTLEKGMGAYNFKHQTLQFYPYKKTTLLKSPIKTFCYYSPHRFLVAAMDSLPAIFNTESRTYAFIEDSLFHNSPNQTTDIKIDKLGDIFLFKGGHFYISPASKNTFLKGGLIPDSNLMVPFFRQIYLLNGTELASLDVNPELLKRIILKHNQNSIAILYDVNDLTDSKEIQFAYKVDKVTDEWIEMPNYNIDSSQVIYLDKLEPGKYLLQLKVKVGKEDWRKQMAQMEIIVLPPLWKRWWFLAGAILLLSSIIYFITRWRIQSVRKQERTKAAYEKELMELEAKALRAQMNPHFIFNCLNSIKSLIQEGNEEKSVTYLTTFSKLIRTLFNNADKKEITLYDEIETCRLYLQLEAMRFDAKFSYAIDVDPNIDLKSVYVPALIIQPFIENSIWHGIVPKEKKGYVNLSVMQNNGVVKITVDDNGIGREASIQNKAVSRIAHQSKGVTLTKSRLELDNLLQQRQAQLEIIDKKDDNGVAMGTTVILNINQENV